MKNLSSRIISAVVALTVLFFAVYFGRESGVYVVALLIVIRGAYEIARMFFNEAYPAFTRSLLVLLVSAIFLVITQDNFQSLAGIALIFSFVLVTVVGILFHKWFKSVDQLLSFILKNCVALIYACLLPATVIWTLQTNNGMEWFLCLLAVVFAGDIGAYIFGTLFGKTKIAPLLSPKKSLQGAVGGLIFSIVAACLFQLLINNTPIYIFIVTGLLGGFLGQVGDFFESLIKRVSGVKDSGSIMPGHGGVLDRLDGVFLAAPLFFIAATYFSI